MSAEDRMTLPASGSGSGVALPDDELDALRAELAAEREARAHAEARAAEWDARVAKLEGDLRTLATLRDNFHNLYREERELRATAERAADSFTEERDGLENQLAGLRSEVERLQRAGARPAQPAAAPVEPPPAAAPQGQADRHLTELEHEMGMLRAHAADLEAALVEREAAIVQRDAALAETRDRGADGPGEGRSELVAATRRIHDLDGELAVLRKEQTDLRAAHDRLAGMRQKLEEQLHAEQALRAEAQRVATEAGQRSAEAVRRESQAVAEAAALRDAAERTDLALQAAKASIGVLEQRLRETEDGRTAIERRVHELEEELSFVRSDVLTGRAAQGRRPLLRRRGQPESTPHLETTGTPVDNATPVEVAGAAEDVEQALHRRLFSEP